MTTLEEVLAEVKKNKRVCPQPQRWQQLFEMLPDKQRKGAGWEPSLPLILAAWWDTPAMSKMLCLREHIEWAASHGCLEEVNSFLCELPEDQWHHIGEWYAQPCPQMGLRKSTQPLSSTFGKRDEEK